MPTSVSMRLATFLPLLTSDGTASISLPCQPAPAVCFANDFFYIQLPQSTQIPAPLHLAFASVKIQNDGMS